MSTLFLLAALATIPHGEVVECRVDVLEINHFYSEEGCPVFIQLVAWDLADDGQYHATAWRMVHRLALWPQRGGKGWYAVWVDGYDPRRVRAGSFRESWSQVDPELLDRDVVPACERRGLGK